MNAISHDTIKKAILKSQHCQRNWDLTRQIPQEDLDLIITSATHCPSKQNVSHYNLHAITNRELIEKIYAVTKGFQTSNKPATDGDEMITFGEYEAVGNTQILANLLLVFERKKVDFSQHDRYAAIRILANNGKNDPNSDVVIDEKLTLDVLMMDVHMSVGVAAGYANMTSALLGYGTGCCTCFQSDKVIEILNLQDNGPVLMMGIGFKDPSLPRRVSQTNHDFVFPTFSKNHIDVIYHN
jgi:nitroreductase